MLLLTCTFVQLLSATPGSANAQVHRCVDRNGKVQFSNMGCPASTAGVPVDTTGNVLDTSGMRAQTRNELAAIEQRRLFERAQVAAPAVVGPSGSACPSERDIANMRTSVSSPSLSSKERAFHEAEIRRALHCRSGEGTYTASDWKQSKEALAAQRSVSADVRQRQRAQAEDMHAAANPAEGARIAQERAAEAVRAQAQREAAAQRLLRNPTITMCNASGCSASDGRFFSGSGGTYFGHGMTCTRLGQQLSCN